MPKLDGTLALGGLKAPVSVVRDDHGVPSITAQSLDDLFFAQGFVTAQDRLWQMDMLRRYGAGELAAALGKDYVETDRQQRVLGLRDVAERSVAALDPQTRQQLEDYARGVNAYMEEHQYSLPLEMQVMRYRPRAWTAVDSALVGLVMAEMLNHGTYLDDLNHEKVLARLGPELTADLYQTRSERDIAPGHDQDEMEPLPGTLNSEEEEEAGGEAEQTVPPHSRPAAHRTAAKGHNARAAQTPHAARKQRKAQATHGHRARRSEMVLPAALPIDSDPLRAGSNDWVISGAHTASGRPLLSNDMHLPLRIPNTWYEAHLTCGDYDVAGVTLPGAPWVVAGHNRRVAWGFTNVGPDVEDVYLENFNAQGEYQTPQGWQKPVVRHEVIHVKRGRDVEMDVVVTRHGPIVSDVMKNEPRRLALRWALYDTGVSMPFFAINSAQNWEQMRAALAQFAGPGQNVVYADVDGNIGYQATGRVPIRAAGDGSLPVAGWNDDHEWLAYVPFDAMPTAYNPPSGIIATANGRITPEGYPFLITTEWGPPYRTERIYKVLRQNKKFTAEDMLGLQNDVQSELDKFLAERMVYAVDQTTQSSPRARQAAEILRHFDGAMTTDSAGAAIEQKARRWLTETLLKNKLGAESGLYHWYAMTVWLENTVGFQQQRWLPAQYKTWNDLLAASVEAAVNDPAAPRNLPSWKYGDFSTVQVGHPIFSKIPWLKKYATTAKLPQSGNGTTVKQVGTVFSPSERFTADFADLDRSTLNIVNGQSGNLFSPYFNDQFMAWYNGTTFRLPFNPQTVEDTARHHLQLVPQ
ncbi:MAG: penicillin acylase family protein [Acidobacteriota bacterium]|nr:penicillin acylase family protein [Acidobacteriota bacterium]